MTGPRYSDDAAILDRWIRTDITTGQGTGRRVSKAALALGWYGSREDEDRMRAAVAELLAGGDYTTDEPVPGFVYLVPKVGSR